MATPQAARIPSRRARRSRSVRALAAMLPLVLALITLHSLRGDFVCAQGPVRLAQNRRLVATPLQARSVKRNWETLGNRGKLLKEELADLSFEGTAADGGVVVAVDGQQRPMGLQLAENLTIAGDLGRLIEEAYSMAAQRSMSDMTRRVQELCAGFFAELQGEDAV